jgi:hypothetical protein
MIAKEDLVDGALYEGRCRNATQARWDAKIGKFIYRRHKFGDWYKEEIEHPADFRGYDVFVPERMIVE